MLNTVWTLIDTYLFPERFLMKVSLIKLILWHFESYVHCVFMLQNTSVFFLQCLEWKVQSDVYTRVALLTPFDLPFVAAKNIRLLVP